MKHNPVSTAHAAGATTAVLYLVCRFLIGIFPEASYQVVQSWFHGLELQKLGSWNLNMGNFFLGLVSSVVGAWILGYIFSTFYNIFEPKK